MKKHKNMYKMILILYLQKVRYDIEALLKTLKGTRFQLKPNQNETLCSFAPSF